MAGQVQPSTRSTTSYAILGLLSVRPWSTYELAKQVQRSLNWFWPRAERKLYDEPKRLVADGLATATAEHTGQRPRTVYAINDRGREALRRWLETPSAPRTVEFEAMLKLFFADAGSLDQLQAILDEVEREATERMVELTDMSEQGTAGTYPFPQRRHISAIALRLQFEQEAAILRWVGWARNQVPAWRDTSDPAGWDYSASLQEIAAQARDILDGLTRGSHGRRNRR